MADRNPYGGAIQWEAAFFGWLAAIGLAALLVAMAVGAGVAVGLTDIEARASEEAEELSLAGGALLVAILAAAYLAGGYVAGRMARFEGWRQGLGVWLLALLMTAALAVTAWIAGGEINPLESLELPRIPVEEKGEFTWRGGLALGMAILVTLAAAIGGGILGERFHRSIDAGGGEPPTEPEPEPEPAPEPEPESESESESEPQPEREET